MQHVVTDYHNPQLYGNSLRLPMYWAINKLPNKTYEWNFIRAIGVVALMILALPIFLVGLGISAIHYHTLDKHPRHNIRLLTTTLFLELLPQKPQNQA